MHKNIKLEKDFPLIHLGYETIVKYNETKRTYSSVVNINGRYTSIEDRDPKKVEESFKDLVTRHIDNM